jgi:hypothetical protein
VDVESVRSIGFRQVVGVLERALDPAVSLEVLEEAMRRLTELDAAGALSAAAVSVASSTSAADAPSPEPAAASQKRAAVPPVEGTA